MSRLWTPGNPEKRAGQLEILVPRGQEQPRPLLCRTCGSRFMAEERAVWERHVGECARRNMDDLLADAPKRRMPWSDENNWDPEAAEHMRKVGERMLKEGRLETKPNERIIDG